MAGSGRAAGARALIALTVVLILTACTQDPPREITAGTPSSRLPEPERTTAEAGHAVITSQDPRWFAYDDGSPIFICGAGEPEDFLYRGTRQPDGTRDGDQRALIDKLAVSGANAIYFQAIRSHGGDGEDDHNPFIDHDPANDLNPAILAQWQEWLTAADEAGIVSYFFLYDDSSTIFPHDEIPDVEHQFVTDIVTAFNYLDHLVWVIAEEYEEALSPQKVSDLADLVAAVDDRDHPIAVHKQIGNTFTEFADAENIDSYAMQVPPDLPEEELYDYIRTGVDEAAGRWNVTFAEQTEQPAGEPTRRIIWNAAMAGTYPLVFPWDIATTPPEELAWCGAMVDFLKAVDTRGMSPNDELAREGSEHVIAEPGERWVAYSAQDANAFGIADMPAGNYELRWLDIVSGDTREEQDVTVEAGDQAFEVPNGFGSEVALAAVRSRRD